MEGVKTYLLSVSGAAIVCSLANRFLGDKGAAAAGKLITALLLVLTVMKPLASNGISVWSNISFEIKQGACEAIQNGEDETRKALAEIIKEKTEAYILQKAQALHAEITVNVAVTEDAVPVPEGVLISGNIGPYAKQQLQRMMVQDLGIAKEKQRWI